MDQEVAKTLGELELKLQELERELTTIGHHEKPAQPEDKPAETLQAPGRLIDEAVEHVDGADSTTDDESSAAAGHVLATGFGGGPIFGGEEVPAQGGATIEHWTVDVRETAYGEITTPPPDDPARPPSPHEPPPAPDPTPPAPGPPIPPPAPPPPTSPPTPQPPSPPPTMENGSIDISELVRFRDKLASTMDELIAEYSRLLSTQAPTRTWPGA